MVVTAATGALCGIDCRIVTVEVDVSKGLPVMEMTGKLSAEVREAQMRIRVALKNTGITLPPQRITVNLAPASLQKEGTQYDLPVAAALLAAGGYVPEDTLKGCFLAGELGLDGEVKGVRGILPMVLEARKQGMKEMIVAPDNVREAKVVSGIAVCGVKDLSELIAYLMQEPGRRAASCEFGTEEDKEEAEETQEPDFGEICGQEGMKRVMEVAAAGFHNLLMIGPPGAGKTMAAKRLPGILPPITEEEALEVSKIYSVAGLLVGGGLIRKRPFVAPHHSVTLQALAGGGCNPRPGLVSRAHKGVLFLDETVHFSAAALEVLRQPMEDKKLLIARSNASYVFPAEFMLVAAINPCPCGNYPDPGRCRCTADQVRRYLGKLSGPLLDRIDLCVEMGRVELSDYRKGRSRDEQWCSEAMRERVMKARKLQEERFSDETIRFNAQMGVKELEKYAGLGKEEQDFMDIVYEKLHLSLRSYHRILKVARTIADLDGELQLGIAQLQEALCYRGVEERYWG